MTITINSAVEAMRAGHWVEAARLWRGLLCSDSFLSADDYNACARVWERLGDWEAYREVIVNGLARFPADKGLQRRRHHAQAITLMAEKKWQEAWRILEQLRSQPLDMEWPCGCNYWSRQARFEKTVKPIMGREARLVVLAELSLLKASVPLSQCIAGIELAVHCLDWPPELAGKFCRVVEKLISVLRCYNQSLDLIEDVELAPAVSDLYEFWVENDMYLRALPLGYYNFFSLLFLRFGYFNLYYNLRAHFVELLKEHNRLSQGKAVIAYRVALANELGDYADYCRLREAFHGQSKFGRYLGVSAVYYCGERYESPVDDQDKYFSEFIKGKRVAVVGPVDVGLDSGAEIDGFDVVVRFNHRHGILHDSTRFGQRTDVAYYVRNMLSRDAPPSGLLEGVRELKWAVIEENSYSECAWLESIECDVRIRPDHWSYLNNPMLMGLACAVPRALLDILRFSPGQVKVFSTNMYTNINYCEGYLIKPCVDGMPNLLPGFSLHDPVSNFILIQRLAGTGRIDVDDVLKEVIAMDAKTYVERLSAANFRHAPHAFNS